ncbi:MAG TPA: PIN domain-containing protein [Acidobacteriota bacterium]|nr:PIN domain-containing protein [Acidobacteriota bacterium]
MRAVFADTFYWVALTNPGDSSHAQALTFDKTVLAEAEIVTIDEILIEFLTFFSSDPWLRNRAAVTTTALLRKPGVRVLPQNRDSFLAGLELYTARPDKGYSLTDCIAMQTMRRHGIMEILTNDRHFSQEGFRALFVDA